MSDYNNCKIYSNNDFECTQLFNKRLITDNCFNPSHICEHIIDLVEAKAMQGRDISSWMKERHDAIESDLGDSGYFGIFNNNKVINRLLKYKCIQNNELYYNLIDLISVDHDDDEEVELIDDDDGCDDKYFTIIIDISDTDYSVDYMKNNYSSITTINFDYILTGVFVFAPTKEKFQQYCEGTYLEEDINNIQEF